MAWAESIREMLVSEAMPPWHTDPTGPAVKNSHALTPRELDILVTWATGGTPHGDLNKPTPNLPFEVRWTLGKPDLEIPMVAKVFSMIGDGMVMRRATDPDFDARAVMPAVMALVGKLLNPQPVAAEGEDLSEPRR